MEEWKEYKLGDISTFTQGIQVDVENQFDEYKNGLVRFIRIVDYTKQDEAIRYIVCPRSQCICNSGDIVMIRYGSQTAGKVFKAFDGAIANNMFKINIDENKMSKDFAYYYLGQVCIQNFLKGAQSSSTMPAITFELASKIKLFVPPIFMQEKIVSILKSLDDKIELNRRINDNLEQQSQRLFDDCLVNSHSTNLCKLSDIADINPKRVISKTDCNRYIEMSNLPTKGSFPSGWEYKQFNGGMKFTNGDTIMARITPCLENGKVAYINFLESDEVAFGSTEYIVISSKGEYPSEWFYFLTRNKQFVDYAIKNMNGSSGRQRVTADSIAEYELPFIAKNELKSVFSLVKVALKTIKRNSLENIRLSAIRDALLPKLMSGELKINDLNS